MKKELQDYLLKIIKGKKNSFSAKVVKFLLTILEYLYLIIIKIREIFYKIGIFKKNELDVKIISVGNITTGGTGKTPVVKKLALGLKNKGKKVAILSRGYNSKGKKKQIISDGDKILIEVEEAGDELYMLASHLSDIPIIKAKDRFEGGKLALENFDLDIIILDDSFQHWQLKRDLDIVVIDALNPFGYDHLLPRGILREPLSSLNRADMVIISRAEQVSDERLLEIQKRIRNYNFKVDIFNSKHNPINIAEIASNSEMSYDELSDLHDKKALALSGIGNPESFKKSLEELGVDVVVAANYPDHYKYKSEDVMDIAMQAQLNEANLVITTEKDAVKFDIDIIDNFNKMEVDIYSLEIDLNFINKDGFSKRVLEILNNK